MLIKKQKLNNLKASDYYEKALEDVKLHNIESAKSNFEKAIKETQFDCVDFWKDYVKFLIDIDEKDYAIKFLEEIEVEIDKKVQKSPGSAFAKGYVVDLYCLLDKKDAALKIGIDLCDLLPFEGYESTVLDLYIRDKKYQKAIDFVTILIKQHPDFKEFYYLRGEIYFDELADYRNAISDFKKYAELSSEKPGMFTFNYIAESYSELGEYENAIEYFNKAIEASPETDFLWNQLGNAYRELDKFEAAYDAFKKSFELLQLLNGNNNSKSTARASMAKCLLKLKKYDEAEVLYLEALQLNPKNYIALYDFACDLSLQNKKDQALENLQKAVVLHPEMKDEAKEDPDFDNIKDDSRFKKLLEN